MDIHDREQPGIDTRKLNGRVSPKKRRAYNGIRFTKPPSRQGKTIGIDQRHRKKRPASPFALLSLVMNNKDRNRVSKRRWRNECAKRPQSMGYKPNSVARDIAHQKVVCPRLYHDEIATTPYAGRVLVGAQEAARKLGYILLTVNTRLDQGTENQEVRGLQTRYRVDGFYMP